MRKRVGAFVISKAPRIAGSWPSSHCDRARHDPRCRPARAIAALGIFLARAALARGGCLHKTGLARS